MANGSSSTTPSLVCLALLFTVAIPAFPQRTQSAPATDTSAQASPLNATPNSPAMDSSMQASPISAAHTSGVWVAPHTAIAVSLEEALDSGRVKQGQSVKARLTSPVSVHGGPMLPAGTPVELSIIAAVPAGRIMAQGELSLQILRVGSLSVYTDTLVFDGKPGHQDLPDSAPALGTDAGLASGAKLTFHVQPQPTDSATPLATTANRIPGSVDGTAPGGPPPPSDVKSSYGNPNSLPGNGNFNSQQGTVTPANTTTNQQVQHLGQPSPAPNQPQPPSGTTPTTSPR